jgi:hypothetical protein
VADVVATNGVVHVVDSAFSFRQRLAELLVQPGRCGGLQRQRFFNNCATFPNHILALDPRHTLETVDPRL